MTQKLLSFLRDGLAATTDQQPGAAAQLRPALDHDCTYIEWHGHSPSTVATIPCARPRRRDFLESRADHCSFADT